MRINHNIASLNTYRQLTGNTTNTSKSLEKLSSGLRINRAGDDAAGLAISEKMRAQIRGLDQASRNAQDGISMLQTAEGALNEVHSILQRMRELANQAASDTNVKVDRDEIQKEINQLTSEINRIGNTTEFNTQRLLDGGTLKTAITTATKGLAVAQGAAAVTVNTSSQLEAQVGKVSVAQTTASVKKVDEVLGKTSIDITTALAAGKTLTINGVAVTFASGGNVDTDTANTAALQATALATYITAQNGAGQVGENWSAAVDASDNTKIILTQRAGEGSPAAATAVVGGGAGVGAVIVREELEGVTAVTGTPGVYDLEIETAFEAGESIIIGGQVFTFGSGDDYDVDIDSDDTASEQATALKALIDANATLAARFAAAGGATNHITLTEESAAVATGAALTATAKPAQTAGDYDLEITKLFKAGEQITFGGQTFTAVASGANAANGQFAAGASIEDQIESLKEAVEAKLGNRFTVTLEDNKLNLVEKTAQATGEDLVVTKTGNVQGSVSYKQVDESSKGTAAKWSTGDFTALVNGKSGTLTFNGFTINLSGSDTAVTGATNKTATSIDIAIETDTLTSADAQAATIANLLNAQKADTPLADFTFAADGATITITDKTDTATGIATNGDNHNSLVIGFTGDVAIANTSNAAQLDTAGVDAQKAKYTFDITGAFKVNEAIDIGGRKFTGVTGEANALLGEFSVNGTKAEQATSLKKAIEATTALTSKYDVAVSGSKITLTEKTAGQETAKLAAPTTELTKATAGVYTFKAQVVDASQVYKIDGTVIKVVNDAELYHDEIATGTAILAADNAKTQADNLRAAINLNETLSAKYTAEGSDETVKLTQQEGAESPSQPVITVERQGADGKFVANFQIGANTGQSIAIEIGDIRAVALKISGTEAGINVSAKNGVEASYVTAVSVSNGTDNTSVEFSLDVSDHTRASAAVSVIQDAIDAVSAQRSQMGAYQNRLEHTINNLGTSGENLTAAESRIRDVDMAKEMMEFTKNNILSQAAQAMLAQANQQPQGVLQLLR